MAKKVVGLAAAFAAILGLITAQAVAQDDTSTDETSDDVIVEIPMETEYIGGKAGSVHELGSVAVAEELVGLSCNIVADIVNQGSVHPGNVLVVSTGDTELRVEDIEAVADATKTEAGTVTLGESISASIVLGEDGQSSLGSNLKLTCEKLPEAKPAEKVPETPTYTG